MLHLKKLFSLSLLFLISLYIFTSNKVVSAEEEKKEENNTKTVEFPLVEDAIEFAYLHYLVHNNEEVCENDDLLPNHVRCHAYFSTEVGTEVMVVSSVVKKFVAVVFAGSNSKIDWVMDSLLILVPFGPKDDPINENVKVHLGFNTAVFGLRLYERIFEVVTLVLVSFPDYEIVVAGHSLGAACAQLTAAALSHDLPDHSIDVFAYGCPKVGDKSWQIYMNENEKISNNWRFVLDDDVVPRLWVGPSYFHAGHTIQMESDEAIAYYLHYGDEELGYAGVPDEWNERGLNWTSSGLFGAEGWDRHNVMLYMDYFVYKSFVESEKFYPSEFLEGPVSNGDYQYFDIDLNSTSISIVDFLN